MVLVRTGTEEHHEDPCAAAAPARLWDLLEASVGTGLLGPAYLEEEVLLGLSMEEGHGDPLDPEDVAVLSSPSDLWEAKVLSDPWEATVPVTGMRLVDLLQPP